MPKHAGEEGRGLNRQAPITFSLNITRLKVVLWPSSDALRARAAALPGATNAATRLALNTAATTVDTLAPTTGPLVNTITVNVAPGDGILDVAPVCFVRGTLIETVNGLQSIETLKVGDMVMTRDHGL